MFDMSQSTAIRHSTFKTTSALVDATVNETLSLGDYRSLQFFHRVKFSSVINSLLNGTPNSIVRLGPHVRLFSDNQLHNRPSLRKK